MSRATFGPSRFAYAGSWAIIALATAFPIGLMIFDPTLMFKRGWEQYAGTSIFFWAIMTLALETWRLGRGEREMATADTLLDGEIPETAQGPVALRVRQLRAHAALGSMHLMEVNREASGLDQEESSGRFTLPRYILYLLPVIGFIGTVEGISHALKSMSDVLPQISDLSGFIGKLGDVTGALQVAFDSTLLALFLSAWLMLVSTLVQKLADDQLARLDRWVMEMALPKLALSTESLDPTAVMIAQTIAVRLDAVTAALHEAGARMGAGIGPHVERFAQSVDRLPGSLQAFQKGADAVGRLGDGLTEMGAVQETIRKGVLSIARIESTLQNGDASTERLEEIKRGLDRACVSIESLASSWAASFERSSRSSQEQLARTLSSLKDALDLLNVSMEQGNALYRNIVKKMFDRDAEGASRAA
ncbi:MAG: MotA/TolQ/ExbB proton channel family protein [Isosphaeraceae bacterium]|nr:MotA/TolQ/ExbB proton channel family protein [Isosphaeraceae bacterium]